MGSKRLCPKVVTELGVGREAFCACAVVCYYVCIQVIAKEDASLGVGSGAGERLDDGSSG